MDRFGIIFDDGNEAACTFLSRDIYMRNFELRYGVYVYNENTLATQHSINVPMALSQRYFDIVLIWPRGYKTFPCSTQLSTKFILFKNVKMPTVVGILTFISMINTSERLKTRNFIICRYLSFMSS